MINISNNLLFLFFQERGIIMKKIISLCLCMVMCCCLLTGCSSKKSIEESQIGFDALLTQADSYADSQDYNAFKGLCYGESEQIIQQLYNAFISVDLNSFASSITNIPYESNYNSSEQLFLATKGYYTTSGVYPTTNINSYNITVPIIFIDEMWKFVTDATLIEGFAEEAYFSLLGESFKNAHQSGRTAIVMNTPIFINNPNLYYEGCLSTNAVAMWQEANGDLSIYLWTSNGTGGNRGVSNISIDIVDSQLGQVVDTSLDLSYSVKNAYSDYRVITIPSSQIFTGTQKLSSVSFNIHHDNV